MMGSRTFCDDSMLTLNPKETDVTPEEWAKVQEIQFNEWCRYWPITPVSELVDKIRAESKVDGN